MWSFQIPLCPSVNSLTSFFEALPGSGRLVEALLPLIPKHKNRLARYRKKLIFSRGKDLDPISRLKAGVGADVAKWIKAVDCESTTRGFNPRRSPINKWTISYGDRRESTYQAFFLQVISRLSKKGIQAIAIPFQDRKHRFASPTCFKHKWRCNPSHFILFSFF